jgi:predicted O-methyltransferase YrrM
VQQVLARLGLDGVGVPALEAADEDWSIEPEARQILLGVIGAVSPRNYLEIGAHRGTTCVAVARLFKSSGRGRAYAIEPDGSLAESIRASVAAEDLPLTVLELTSARAFDRWGREEIDAVLVDGDHSFSSAVFDLASWTSLLSDEGWLFVHDTISRLERRFPEDYLAVPGVFDILDVVGLRVRPSGHFWEGLAVARWSEAGRLIRGDRHVRRPTR